MNSGPATGRGVNGYVLAGTAAGAVLAAVIAAVQAKGFAPAEDNEADAIAILLWAIETRGGVR